MEKIRKTDEEWRQQLSREQFHVTREKGTEPAFTGRYHNNHEHGTYKCVCCGTPLFALTLRGMARAFGILAAATPATGATPADNAEAAVASAMRRRTSSDPSPRTGSGCRSSACLESTRSGGCVSVRSRRPSGRTSTCSGVTAS